MIALQTLKRTKWSALSATNSCFPVSDRRSSPTRNSPLPLEAQTPHSKNTLRQLPCKAAGLFKLAQAGWIQVYQRVAGFLSLRAGPRFSANNAFASQQAAWRWCGCNAMRRLQPGVPGVTAGLQKKAEVCAWHDSNRQRALITQRAQISHDTRLCVSVAERGDSLISSGLFDTMLSGCRLVLECLQLAVAKQRAQTRKWMSNTGARPQ